MKRVILFLIMLLISTTALAVDWRFVVTKKSDGSKIDVDYDSVYVKNNFLIFTSKSNSEGLDFPRFSRQLIMSEITKRKLNERHQIYRRV